MSEDFSRRNLFQIIGAVPAVAAVAGAEVMHDHAHMAAPADPAAKTPYKLQAFDEHQYQTIKVLCDLIIPADSRSASATQAGVPEFLDDWLAFRTEQDHNTNLSARIFGGLMWLDREAQPSTFIKLSAEEQKKLLDRIAYPAKAAPEDGPYVRFFSELRSLTVSGYCSSREGVKFLEYMGNRAVAQWKGCDPKVWAVIEERLKNGYKDGVIEAKPWGA